MTPVMNTRVRTLLLLVLITGPVRISWAHALLVDSTPKASSTISGSDLDVNLRFNVRIDSDRSRLRLVKPDGTTSTLSLASRSKPDTLQTHAGGLQPGEYKLEWQVLASDGHISRGTIPFKVN